MEPRVSRWYRGAFCNIPKFARMIAQHCGCERILEIGCGEGALISELGRLLPRSSIVGIDICENVGRLYEGTHPDVRFLRIGMEAYLTQNPMSFDTVIMCDVLHHIERERRLDALRTAGRFLAGGGLFVLKDWVRDRSPIHMMVFLSDRYVTGDKNVAYHDQRELQDLLTAAFGPESIIARRKVPPHVNNVAFFIKA